MCQTKVPFRDYRDYALLLFMYNSGARASEAANLTIGNLMFGPTQLPQVIIHGKGGKRRNCPLWDNTVETLEKLIRGRDNHENVFLNRFNNPITRSGIYDVVTKYAAIVSEQYPSIAKKESALILSDISQQVIFWKQVLISTLYVHG